jgi:transposase
MWQNEGLTYIVPSAHRDFKTIAEEFPQGLPRATMVSDCLSAQLKTPAKGHQLCVAHLLRELNNFESSLKSEWSVQCKETLQQAVELKKRMMKADYEQAPPEVARIEGRIDELLSVDSTDFHPKLKAFIKRLVKHRGSILRFLYNGDVPADNNGSERGIRNVKVKLKVSGQFRTTDGARRFAKIRSIIDTTIKNGQKIFTALSSLAFCPS